RSRGLLPGAVAAVFVRRRGRILDSAEEEMRRGFERAAREVLAVGEAARDREQLRAVEVEDSAGLGLVPGGHVVAGQAAEVLDAVQGGADDVGLERDAVPVAAH